MQLPPPNHLLVGAIVLAFAGPGCGSDTSSTCGDDVLDVGEACLVEHDVSLEPLLALGDVDGDGRSDAVVIVDRNARRVAVRRGEADGSFGPAGLGMIAPALPTTAAVGDADGDGAADVVLWWPTSDGAGELCGHAFEPGGTLGSQWCHAALEPAGVSSRLVIGALGPAGEAGLAAWAQGRAQVVIDPADAATETWLELPITEDGTIPLQLADLDGDGLDALLWIADARLEQHAAPWGAPASTDVPEGLTEAVVADYDRDGIDDLALVSPLCVGMGLGATAVQVRLSTGPKVEGTLGGLAGCMAYGAGDLDGDGRAELFAATESSFAVWWGQALTEAESVEAVVIDGPALGDWHGLVVGDVDGDGLADPMLTIADDLLWESAFLPQWITEVWLTEP
jgi:hypothetical protein